MGMIDDDPVLKLLRRYESECSRRIVRFKAMFKHQRQGESYVKPTRGEPEVPPRPRRGGVPARAGGDRGAGGAAAGRGRADPRVRRRAADRRLETPAFEPAADSRPTWRRRSPRRSRCRGGWSEWVRRVGFSLPVMGRRQVETCYKN